MPYFLYYPLSLLWEKLRKAHRNNDTEEIERLEALRDEIRRAGQNNLLYAGVLFALLLNKKGRDAFVAFRPVLLRLIMTFNQMTIAFAQAGSKAPMMGIACTIAYTNICRKLGLIDSETTHLISTLMIGVNTAGEVSDIIAGVLSKFTELFKGLHQVTATMPASVLFDIPDEPLPKEIPLEMAMKLVGMKARIPIEESEFETPP